MSSGSCATRTLLGSMTYDPPCVGFLLCCYSEPMLDTGFGEDLSRVRDRYAAANLAVLRRIALNLVRADTTSSGNLKGKRKMAGWDDAFMQRLVAE